MIYLQDLCRNSIVRSLWSDSKQSPHRVYFFVSLRAGGVGLNLGMATHVIVFDRWWNPAVEIQAIYRAHRFQRDKSLHVIRFLVVDTIEERIARILNHKENIFENVIESTETNTSRFTVEELRQILELPEIEICST